MTTITVADAYKFRQSGPATLYSTHRGNRVTGIQFSKGWYIVTFSSGGKRHVRGDHQLCYEKK